MAKNKKSKHSIDAKYGWYHYTTRFAILVEDSKENVKSFNVFIANLLIRNDKYGKKYLYDILNIKKENSSKLPAPLVEKVRNIRSNSLNTNITQDNTDVNNNSMQEVTKYSIDKQRKNTRPDIDRTDVVFADDGVSYSIDKHFAETYDNWDKKKTGVSFRVGKTSIVLQKLGIDNRSIWFDASKIIKIKSKHPAMTDDVIKQIPNLLEKPILVMKSLTNSNRIVIFGEVYDTNNDPVLAVIELKPTDKKGNEISILKIASAYGKDTNPQNLINKSDILYVEPNKKRTHNWLTVNRLQLPLPSANYGFIKTIKPQNSVIVNNNSMQKHEKDVLYQQRNSDEINITPHMEDIDRAKILRNKTIKLVKYTGNHNLSEDVVEKLKDRTTKNATKVLRVLGEKFGVYKNHSNENIDFKFDYSRSTLKESLHKQGELNTGFTDFAKMLYVFDDVVKNAVPIEVHTDKYAGTKRANQNLKYDYVFISAFTDEKFIVPVELHIKEFSKITDAPNKLYVTVTLGKIKMEDNVMTAERQTNKKSAVDTVQLSSKISLPQMISKINPDYGNFYKYIPSELLNKEQIKSKQIAVDAENNRILQMRNQNVDIDSEIKYQQRSSGEIESSKPYNIDPSTLDEKGLKVYNNRGWSYSLFTKEDRLLLQKAFEQLNGSLRTDNVLGDGTRIADINNKIVLIGGTFENPQVHSVIVFNSNNETDIAEFKRGFIYGSDFIYRNKNEFIELVQNVQTDIGKEQVRGYAQDDFRYIRSRDKTWQRAEIPSNFKNYGYTKQYGQRNGDNGEADGGFSEVQINDDSVDYSQ